MIAAIDARKSTAETGINDEDTSVPASVRTCPPLPQSPLHRGTDRGNRLFLPASRLV